MKIGAAVEVNFILAYSFPEPLRTWSKGYEFVRFEPATHLLPQSVIVKHTIGLYKGIEVRYSIKDVRPHSEP